MEFQQMWNPYYDPEKLGLDKFTFEEELSYEFNILLFVKTPDGRVFSASDSGCSCPKPFEDYEGHTQDNVLQGMERIGSIEQAERIFDSWNSCQKWGKDEPIVPKSQFQCLRTWMGIPTS